MARVKIQYRLIPNDSRPCCETHFLGWLNRLVDRLQEYSATAINIYTAEIDPTSDYAELDVKGNDAAVAQAISMIKNFDARWQTVDTKPEKLGELQFECQLAVQRRERGY